MKYLNLKKALAAWQNLQPLSEKNRDRLSRRFTVDFNYNSNHIEGNTLTYGQTEILLLFGKVIGEADVRDVQEMTASNVGLRMMMEEAVLKEMPLTQNFIRTLHKTILREDYTVYRNLPGGIPTSYVIHAGQYKTRPNSVITRYGDRFEYASPEETPGLMGDLVDWYNATEQEGKLSPVELAALFHYRYIRIHPFEDGNGRVGRLWHTLLLSRWNPVFDWLPVESFIHERQEEYYSAINASNNLGQSTPFIELMLSAIKASLLDVINMSDEMCYRTLDKSSMRIRRIEDYLKKHPFIMNADVRILCGVSSATANRILAAMVSDGKLEKCREGGHWAYRKRYYDES